MADWGFKVAKDGYDVKTAAPYQLAATTALQSEPIQLSGTVIHTHSGTSGTTTLTHNLGAAYQFLCCYNGIYILPVLLGQTGAGNAVNYEAYATANTLVVQTTSASSQSFQAIVYYKILFNTI